MVGALSMFVLTTVSAAAPLKIMPIGDSLTAGRTCDPALASCTLPRVSYRKRLGQLLESIAVEFEYVGTQPDDSKIGPDPKLRHEGHPGYTIDQLRTLSVPGTGESPWVALSPDFILLMAGTNDVGTFWAIDCADKTYKCHEPYANVPGFFDPEFDKWVAEAAWDNLRAFILQLRQDLPTAELFVASIPPIKDNLNKVKLYNDLVADQVDVMAVGDKHLHFVNVGATWTVSDLGDGSHPSSVEAYEKMAPSWFKAIVLELFVGGFLGPAGTTVSQNLECGVEPGSTDTYTLDDTQSLATAIEILGDGGSCDLTHNGGHHLVLFQLNLGFGNLGRGTYSLYGGSLLANMELIGVAGTGRFTQFGGANVVEPMVPVAGGLEGTVQIPSEYWCHPSHAPCPPGTGTYDLRGGTLKAVQVRNYDQFRYAGGELTGAFSNAGTLEIVGARTIVGSYGQLAGGQLRLNIGPAVSSQLTTTGRASFEGGSILVTLGAGTDPAIGDTYDLVIASTIDGSGVSLSRLPSLFRLPILQGAKMFRPSIVGDTTMRLSVVSLDLDGNKDGVTCADFKIVRNQLGKRVGQSGYDALADVNGDGMVDVRDLATMSQKLPARTSCI